MSVALLLACGWISFHAHTAILAGLAGVMGLAAVAVQLEQSTTIDRGIGKVSRDVSLWGIVLRRSVWSLSDFTGTGVYRLPTGSPNAPADLVHVGLRRIDGSIVAFRYFSTLRDHRCPAAEDFQKELGRAFGGPELI